VYGEARKLGEGRVAVICQETWTLAHRSTGEEEASAEISMEDERCPVCRIIDL